MTSRKSSKINLLLQKWPKGTVATQTWLNRLGISRKLANWHVGSGWLIRFEPRAYTRPLDVIEWNGGLYALQTQLNMTIHVGGLSALELQGRAHFVPLGSNKKILLVSDRQERLPLWYTNHKWNATVVHHCISLFNSVQSVTSTKFNCGGFEILMSSAERAIMEQIHLTRNNDDLDHVHELMRGLNSLRPDVVQNLLMNCISVKVKRFFLWSAESYAHPWFNRLDLTKVNTGTGKRQIYRKGRLNSKYQITVPASEELPSV